MEEHEKPAPKRCPSCRGEPRDCAYLPPGAVRWKMGQWTDRGGNTLIPPACDAPDGESGNKV
jgi:hypothetical protein